MNRTGIVSKVREALNHKSTQACATVGAVLATGTAAASGGGGGGGGTIPGSDGAAADAFSAIQSSAADMISNAWPVAIAVTGGFILLKLGKRAMRSAT